MHTQTETDPLLSPGSTVSKKQSDLVLSLTAEPINTNAWGRSAKRGSWRRAIASTGMVCLAPVLTIVWYISLADFQGSLLAFVRAVGADGLMRILKEHSPKFNFGVTAAYIGWLLLQAVLYVFLPGKTNTGQRTPAGHLLSYRTNGLAAWIATHVAYIGLCSVGVLDLACIPKNWGSLIVAMNCAGYLLSIFSYIKAYIHPTHPDDRKFSGKLLSVHGTYLGLILTLCRVCVV